MKPSKSSFNVSSGLLCLTILIISGAGLAHGEIIGITLDNNCKAFIKNNITSPCPSFEQIDALYNNTPCGYTGVACLQYFEQMEIKNGYIIDPPADVFPRIKIIEIRSNFEEYQLPGPYGGYNNTEHSMSYGLGRFVDKCHFAYIDAAQWLVLTGDSIMFLNSGCTKTYHTAERTMYLERIEHDISTSYKYKLEQWIKESKAKCINKCNEY